MKLFLHYLTSTLSDHSGDIHPYFFWLSPWIKNSFPSRYVDSHVSDCIMHLSNKHTFSSSFSITCPLSSPACLLPISFTSPSALQYLIPKSSGNNAQYNKHSWSVWFFEHIIFHVDPMPFNISPQFIQGHSSIRQCHSQHSIFLLAVVSPTSCIVYPVQGSNLLLLYSLQSALKNSILDKHLVPFPTSCAILSASSFIFCTCFNQENAHACICVLHMKSITHKLYLNIQWNL